MIRIGKSPTLGFVVEASRDGDPDSLKTGIALCTAFGSERRFVCSFAGTTWDSPVSETTVIDSDVRDLLPKVRRFVESLLPGHIVAFRRSIAAP